MDKDTLGGALARGYCTKRNEKKILDPDLIEDMAKEVGLFLVKERYIHKDSIRVDEEKVKEATIDLVDRHFPKGECRERGQAIVLYAEILIAIAQKHFLV